MSDVLSSPAAWLVSGQSASGAGVGVDCRRAAPRGMLHLACAPEGGTGYSGVFDFQVSHDNTGWQTHSTYSATATQSAQIQLTGYFPYVRGVARLIYSGAGGTGALYAHWSPGLV